MSINKDIFNRLLICDANHLILPPDAHESLSTPERVRLAQIANPVPAKLFLLGRYLLRQLLAPKLLLSPSQISISINNKGKPTLFRPEMCRPDKLLPNRLNPSWHFNISHTGSLLALAISNQAPLGVDLESRQLSNTQIQRLARRYFSEDEQAWLAQHPEPEHFLRLWTIKEAVLKAHGGGIANNLSAVHWQPEQDYARFDEQHYQLQHFLLQEDKDASSRLTLAIQGAQATPLELLSVADLGLALEISGDQPNICVSQGI
ncbi:4'-phosphopantetheinyl transferase family protein [Oceanisphaera sp. IT1-181]|uniref:4'-phosphopantetheinyl transferase family protein n=1 Tax=Oceanisphaera sp. IT1-181 TaxID=3081199 RepID=UPI0029CA1797|nr:4'-phosphopantetheinyl transferase superfamily protein [Oceanisphaera sp. IT1-181]